MEIIKLKPVCKDYLWGGRALQDRFNKGCGMARTAESWELSAHPDGESTVDSGIDAGMKFTSYLEKYGKAVLGNDGAAFDFFPVLIKWIDALKPLSVQVHPGDEYALRVEGEYGKTEMWYVMDSRSGAVLYFGVKREITREELRRRIADNSLAEVLNEVQVKPGDVFFIESGTIHAIGGGILICEIQQNSNTTYRIYDYGRRDDNGNLRELHIDKTLEVASLDPPEIKRLPPEAAIPGGTVKRLAECRYFTSDLYNTETEVKLVADETSFVSLSILSGSGELTGAENSLSIKAGDSIFIPAGSGEISVRGKCCFIKTAV